MIESLHSFNLSTLQWLLAALCGLFVGMAKTGLGGLGMIVVPLLAGIFGGRPSVGILLPMLCMGDIFGVSYYNRHAEWKYVLRLMPWTIAGILIGLYVGKIVTGTQFQRILSVTVLLGLVLMIWQNRQQSTLSVPDFWWFSVIMGLAGGFATMISNTAGIIMALYLLSMRLPKNSFIGTGAWFFMIVNLLKVPLHVFIWGTITLKTFSFNLAMLPAIAAGALIGVRIVKLIPEKHYYFFIIVMTALAALKLFF